MIGQRGLPPTHGGVEHHVAEVSVRLARRGHEVVVFCRRNYNGGRERDYRGVQLRYVPTVATKHLEAAIHSGLASVATVGRGFDVVHYHAVGPGIWSPIPRWLTGAVVVQTIHGLVVADASDGSRGKWGRGARRVLHIADWMSMRVPDAVVVVGEYLLGHYSARTGITRHISNGVAIDTRGDASVLARLGIDTGRYVLFVGRLIPEKAVDQLILAFGAVATDAQLVIVGGSSFTDEYELKLKELAYEDPRVVMTGYAYGSDLASLYAGAALYVQPSILEGFPLTVLEASAHGLPMVLSDIPGHLEVIPQQRAGAILFPAGDVVALTEAIALGLRDAEGDRPAARAAGTQVIEKHSWDAVTDEVESLYLELTS